MADEPDDPTNDLPTDFDSGAGDYEVLGELARGGMGSVLRGRDRNLRREVALKVLLAEHEGNPRVERRFAEEARIGGRLQHPGIVPVYDFGRLGDRRPYFAMKLVGGQTLAAMLAERADPADRRGELLAIFERVCQTVAYAHARSVIHRDLKPENVMVGAFGEVQVVDWGLAKVLAGEAGPAEAGAREAGPASESDVSSDGAPDAPSRELVSGPDSDDESGSLAGAVLGSPAYMPPEQARGLTAEIDERADVFALGGILAEILTGASPYEDCELPALQAAAMRELDPIRARLDRCGADEALVALAKRCLAAEREDRPRTAAEVAEAIEGYLVGSEKRAVDARIAAAEAEVEARAERRARRLTLMLAAVVVLAVSGGVGAWMRVREDRRERAERRTVEVQAALRKASSALGEARGSSFAEVEVWGRLAAARDHLRKVADAPMRAAGSGSGAGAGEGASESASAVMEALAEQVEDLDVRIGAAIRDRRMIERLETILIENAPNWDAASWRRMDAEYEAAFRDYGIDVADLDSEATLDTLRSSALRVELADALELWGNTRAMLGERPRDGGPRLPFYDVILAIDPDPFRSERRRASYSFPVDRIAVRDLVERADPEKLGPRSLSWVANASFTIDRDRGLELYRRALVIHPDDAMLHFDFGFWLVSDGRFAEAAQHFRAAIAIRPRAAGLWRFLATSLARGGDVGEGIRAMRRAVELAPDHAPIRVDLGALLLADGLVGEAVEALREASRLDDGSVLAHGRLGQALEAAGDADGARAAFRRCHEIGVAAGRFGDSFEDWLPERAAHIESIGGFVRVPR